MGIEFKRDHTDDPFKDYNAKKKPLESCENESVAGSSSRGQCVMYADRQFAHQHLRFQYQIVVVGSNARFVRYDASGALATHSFNWFDESEYVFYFLEALAKMSPVQCGWDDSVQEITLKDKDAKRFVAAIEAAKKAPVVSPGVLAALNKEYLLCKVKVPDESRTEKYRTMVIQAPFYEGRRVNGRGTRTYIAYDTVDHRLVALKDTWAVSHTALSSEVEILKDLKNAKVPSLSTLR